MRRSAGVDLEPRGASAHESAMEKSVNINETNPDVVELLASIGEACS
jgi:hypothetical protein